MLLLVGLLIVSSVVVAIARMKSSALLHAHSLGWMSERWLAEHRAAEHL
jgi:hypothetical protein